MPRRAEALDDVAVTRRKLEAGPGRLLAHGRAVELLPRCVVLGIGVSALGLQPLAALAELRIGQQDVGPSLAKIDANAVAGLEQREAAADRSLRRGVEDRG